MILFVERTKNKRGESYVALPRQTANGFDLMAAQDVTLKKGELTRINLGVKIYIPKGFQALITPKNGNAELYSLCLADTPIRKFNSDKCEEWSVYGMPINDVTIKKGDRIASFQMLPKINANFAQKLQWLFSKKWKVVEVEDINDVK